MLKNIEKDGALTAICAVKLSELIFSHYRSEELEKKGIYPSKE